MIRKQFISFLLLVSIVSPTYTIIPLGDLPSDDDNHLRNLAAQQELFKQSLIHSYLHHNSSLPTASNYESAMEVESPPNTSLNESYGELPMVSGPYKDANFDGDGNDDNIYTREIIEETNRYPFGRSHPFTVVSEVFDHTNHSSGWFWGDQNTSLPSSPVITAPTTEEKEGPEEGPKPAVGKRDVTEEDDLLPVVDDIIIVGPTSGSSDTSRHKRSAMPVEDTASLPMAKKVKTLPHHFGVVKPSLMAVGGLMALGAGAYKVIQYYQANAYINSVLAGYDGRTLRTISSLQAHLVWAAYSHDHARMYHYLSQPDESENSTWIIPAMTALYFKQPPTEERIRQFQQQLLIYLPKIEKIK
jgi:hypothetical protein